MLNALKPGADPLNHLGDVKDCSVFELRQYLLHEGQRDTLIRIFDSNLVESQEAVGMHIFGQFRDLDRPDVFVWFRGFRDMQTRHEALTAFYGGPAWTANRDAANATMIDSDDVLLLRRANDRSGFPQPRSTRLPLGATVKPSSLITATIYDVRPSRVDEFAQFFEGEVLPVMSETGASAIAYFRTETSENTFAKLPVRTDINAFVSFSYFEALMDYDTHLKRLALHDNWNGRILPELADRLNSVQQLRLSPTDRSELR